MDDEKNGVKEEEVKLPEESPPAEETSEEVAKPEADPSADGATEAEETTTETEDSPKKGYQTRVRELVKERNEAREEAKSFSDRLAEITGSNESQSQEAYTPQQSQDEPIIKPGEELTAEELDTRIKAREVRILQQANAQSDLRQKQSEAIMRINNEAQQSIKLYPELDPENDSFDREMSDTVTEAVESHVRANPYSASVTKFVAKLMKPYRGAVTREAGKASENIAKQVSQAALRPAQVRGKEKPVTEKSIAELEQELGVVQA